MGRAIVRDPQVFLFDEPLSNLDAKLRVQMRHEIRQLQARLGTTGIYVTHDQVEAMTLGDRLVVMNEGRIEQVGTPLEVYERPASLFVAGFIGSPPMNSFDARLGEDRASVLVDGVRLPLAAPLAAAPGAAVVAGMRPEHLQSVADGPLTVAVDWVEMLGADTIAHGRIAGGTRICVRLPGGTVVAEGDRLPLAVPPARLHVFDPESGLRIAESA